MTTSSEESLIDINDESQHESESSADLVRLDAENLDDIIVRK